MLIAAFVLAVVLMFSVPAAISLYEQSLDG
ncbi:MAG: hypothetical protein JWQ36_1790 [Enterovirga sp.]|jgi:hypothetical protein|nr:hypothetical protein [Enterovirga sp.]